MFQRAVFPIQHDECQLGGLSMQATSCKSAFVDFCLVLHGCEIGIQFNGRVQTRVTDSRALRRRGSNSRVEEIA